MNQIRSANVIEALAGYLAERLIRAIVTEGKHDPRRTVSVTVSLKLRTADGMQARYTMTEPLGETMQKLLEEAAMEPAPSVILRRGL